MFYDIIPPQTQLESTISCSSNIILDAILWPDNSYYNPLHFATFSACSSTAAVVQVKTLLSRIFA